MIEPTAETLINLYEQPKVIDIKDLGKFASGACLRTNNPHETGLQALRQLIYRQIQIDIQNYDPEKSLVTSEYWEHPDYKNWQAIPVGRLFANSMYGGYPNKLISNILAKYPDLQWLRGGEKIFSEKGVPQLTNSIAADGYIGDLRALDYAETPFDGSKRNHPALFLIKVRDMLDAANHGFLEIGSSHDYDVSIIPRNQSYDTWAPQHIVLCDLGDDPNNFEKAKTILATHASLVQGEMSN